MANVVRIHVNGFTYTHATATSVDDVLLLGLWSKISKQRLANPLAPLMLDVKADGASTTLMLFPQLVWAFAMWVAPEPTTGGGTGIGVTIGV